MEIFLLITILALSGALICQNKELQGLERKTLNAFRIVCKKINVRKGKK